MQSCHFFTISFILKSTLQYLYGKMTLKINNKICKLKWVLYFIGFYIFSPLIERNQLTSYSLYTMHLCLAQTSIDT